MEYAKLLERSAGKFDYRESPLKTQMKVNELRKTINKDGRANIIKQEPYANKIATYLSKEELKRKTNEGASRYKMAVQDEYDNLVLNKLKNRTDDEFMKTAKKQSEFMKLISDPSKVEYLNKVDPFGLFILRQKQEKDKTDFIRENNELQQYKNLRQQKPEQALQMFQFSENPLIKLFGSHPEDEKLVQDVAQEVGDNNVARRIVAHSGIDAMADQAGLSEGETEELHKEADQVPITHSKVSVETFPSGEPVTFAGEQLVQAPVVKEQTVASLSGATGPSGPITLQEAESMPIPELKRVMLVDYNYKIQSENKPDMIKELQEKDLVSRGITVSSLPSFLPEEEEGEEELSGIIEQEEESRLQKLLSKKDIAKRGLLQASLLSLFKKAEKDVKQLEEEHQKELDKLELKKQKDKLELEKKHNESKEDIAKAQKKQEEYSIRLRKLGEIMGKEPTDKNQDKYNNSQKTYDENQRLLDNAIEESSEEKYLKRVQELEQKHLEEKEKLERKHKEKVSKYAKGNGFKPLSSYPKHIIAGALHRNYLRYRHLIPNQNEYNREQAHRLIQQAKGGNIFSTFLSGIAAPFRLARNINPVFDFGVGKVADALGVPTVSEVINK